MPKSNDIIARFESLPIVQRRKLLLKLYKFSKETEILFKTMLGYSVDASSLIDKMEKETLGKVYRRRMPSGVKVNSIISKAKKYLLKNNNMLLDYVDEAFELVTGEKIKRY